MEALGEATHLNVIRGGEKEMKYNPPKLKKKGCFLWQRHWWRIFPLRA